MVIFHAPRLVPGRYIIHRYCVYPQSTRHISNSLRACNPRKDSQDKGSINTEATEYTRSGTDDSAAHTNVAFDPTVTSPEGEKETAGKENKDSKNPLEVSPANQEVSKPKIGHEGSSAKPPDKKKSGHRSQKRGEAI